MRLEWSAFSFADRESIFDFIEADSPRAAIAVDDAIAKAARQLIDFPESGRIGRVAGTRELVVSALPYLIAYAIQGDVVRILRVLHSAQKWPDDMSN